MGSRVYTSKYDSIETLSAAIRDMERALDTLKHKTSRNTVIGAIKGLKCIIKSLDFYPVKLKRLKELRQKKDNKSRAQATQKWQRWTDDCDRMVMDSALSDFEIGVALGRSRNSVAIRRKRLKENSKVIL